MKKLLLLLLINVISFNINASHNVGLDLSYKHISGETYEVTANYYRDCNGIAASNSLYLNLMSISNCAPSFGQALSIYGTSSEISNICPSQIANSSCNGGSFFGVEHYTYKGLITLPSKCNDWIISYSECCRNEPVGFNSNLITPSSYDIYAEISLDNSGNLNNNSVIFSENQTINICIGQPIDINIGAYDIDGDSLVYSLTAALDNYQTPIAYDAPATPTNPVVGAPNFIDDKGILSITSDGSDELSVINVKVEEYRNGVLIAYSIKDFQVIAGACINDQPIDFGGGITNIIGGSANQNIIEVKAGDTLSFDLAYTDANVSDILTLISTIDSIPNASFTIGGTNPITGNFSWSPIASDIGSYPFNVTVEDDNCPITMSNLFQYQINVTDGNIYYLHGKTYLDSDLNCKHNNNENKLPFIIKTNQSYALNSDSGNFKVGILSSKNYIIEPVVPSYYSDNWLVKSICPINYSVNLNYGSPVDTFGFDFGFDLEPCPLLTVDISSNRRRRCFQNNTYVKYCNEGLIDEDSVKVIVELPQYVNLVSADYTYSINAEGNYVFDIGNLAQGECGTIHIIDSVACINNITGLTQCTKAWITPSNNCVNALDTTIINWDKSSAKVEGVCVGDSIVRFVIYNTGDFGNGDMQGTSEYRVYVDNALSFTGTFQLFGGDSLVIEIPANGQTIRLEADQRDGHPGNSHPRETIEACGNGGIPININLPTQVSFNDEDLIIEEHCLPIIDSYDPNDKNVQPSGLTANNYVKPNSFLEYVIRFQNTGSDTAYQVIVVDTLDPSFDLATIQWGVSSHNYEINVSGNGTVVLAFTFNNINLPDSTTDELNSQGFIKFKIAPKTSIPNGTIISNSADIYFDFNLPIRTNEAWITIFDTTIIGDPITVEIIETKGIEQKTNNDLKIIPNPFNNTFKVAIHNGNLQKNSIIKIHDLFGKVVYDEIINQQNNSEIVIDANELSKGVYILEIKGIGRTKIIKQ